MSPADDPLWDKLREIGCLGDYPVIYLPSTESTNSVAMQSGLAGATPGTLVVAETQTGGRGRLGRIWHSPPGAGLYFSIILRPRLDLADLAKITLLAGVAACQSIEAVTGLRPLIKWPNDLLLNGQKFAGILTESALPAIGRPLVIIGIGINVATPLHLFPADLQGRVTSLDSAAGFSCMRGKLLAAVVTCIQELLSVLEQGGFAAIRAEFSRRDCTLGRLLSWVTPAGAVVQGTALGIDQQGLLHIQDATGRIHEVLSGDVTLADQQKKPAI